MTLSVKMKFFEWQSRWSKKQDIIGLNCIKGASGKVIVHDKGIRLVEGLHGETKN